MIVSRNSAVLGLALASALSLAPTLTEGAEVGPPRQLLPPSEPIVVAPAPKAVPPLEAQPAPPPSTAAPPAEAKTATGVADQSYQVESLKTIDPSSVGVLDASEGGFGTDMWDGTDRALVERLLPRLPVGTSSRTMQRLMKRLLLSTARVPAGPATRPSLLGLRAERLAAAGAVEAVVQLLSAAPAHLDDGVLARADVASRLLIGDNAGACKRAQVMVRQDDDPYWLKGLAFCKALNGEHAAAALGADLLRELGADDDPAFLTLIEALAGDEEAVLDSLFAPTALHLAMLSAARRPIPANAVDGAEPGILSAIATAPNADLELRLIAAERAEAAGALKAEKLGQIYASVAFSPEEMGNALALAESERSGPEGRALLYQVAAIEPQPAARAAVLQKAWLLARENDGFGTAARVSVDQTLAIEPSPKLAWFAADAGRALLAAGRIEAARRWLDLAMEQDPAASPEAGIAAITLWPLLVIAEAEDPPPWSQEIFARWVTHQQELPGTMRRRRLSLMFSLLEGIGYEPERGHWQELLEGRLMVSTHMPTPALWRALEKAGMGRRLGETVLLALLAVGEAGPGRADPITLRAVLAALGQVGLESEARALALEAAIEGGF